MIDAVGGSPVRKIPSRIDGQLCDTYFFESWVGYEHPVELAGPVEFHETHKLKVYYEGSLLDDDDAPKLVRVLKWSVSTTPAPLKDTPAGCRAGHNYFEIAESPDGEESVGARITAEAAAETESFLHVEVGDEGDFLGAERIDKEFVYSYTYTYNDAGALTKAVIKNTEGTKVLALTPDDE